MTDSVPCPCGRAAPLSACCGRAIDQGQPAPDAESLMRSRYTAFVLQRADYLLATWHASTRPAALDFDAGAKWLGLEVRRHRATGEDRAEVEFVARYRVQGRAVRLHERSRFVREGGRWFYVDGDDLNGRFQQRSAHCKKVGPDK
ncbi:MAG: YchJ family metal-binding protein [Acidovorax sp.]|uniref:YchJ family protein n=1 Tax=Acidovorax sp. TaxID=1872122 RepID=UPI0039E3DF31